MVETVTKIKKVSYVPWLGTPLNNEIFKKDKGNWEYVLKKNLLDKGVVIQTNDVLSVEEADACIFFDNIFYKNLEIMWKLYYSKKLHNCVYIDYEPPSGHCRNHSKEGILILSKIFKNVITYNDDYIDNKRIFKGNIGNFYSKDLEYKKDFNNRKLVTMITNNTGLKQLVGILNYCNTSNYYNESNLKVHEQAIYDKRLEAAIYFEMKCPDQFGLYGTLWDELQFKRVLKGYINKDEKCQVMSQYKFIISYDSFVNQKGYISEKIFDAFRAKVVPIYLGADNVNEYIPNNCFIDRRNFNSYDDLYIFLKEMNEKTYEKYISSIEEYLNSKQFMDHFSSEASAKIIENALFEECNEFSYEEAYNGLMYFQKKKDLVDQNRRILFYMTKITDMGYKLQLQFYTSVYTDKKIDYELKINGIKVEIKKLKEKKIIYDNRREFYFKVNLEYKDKPIQLSVEEIQENERIILELVDQSGPNSKKYGIILSEDNKTLNYYNYISVHDFKSKITKIKNGKKINWANLRMILKSNVINFIKYKFYNPINGKIIDPIKVKILRKFEKYINFVYSKKIYMMIFVPINRLFKLPFIYIKDIFDVFNIKNKKTS